MTPGLFIMCPGQGGQHAGMFDLARTDPHGAALLDQAGIDPDAAMPFDNAVAQPAIVACALAMWEALRAHLPKPMLAAGYSVGEVAAWSVAGAITPPDAIALSRVRAAAMDQAARGGPPQALVAISALAIDRAGALAARHGYEIAIVNDIDACIAGGPQDNLAALGESVAAAGAKLQRLPVAVASHTSLMEPARDAFDAALASLRFVTPACPVLGGVNALALRTWAQAVDALSRQLVHTIRWSDCMDAAVEAGVTVALELGPGAALARMMQARHPHIACRSVADFRSIAGIAAWVARQE
ncbi:ACP S-malonyltransferase [Massilia antarctica]|uniref:ACP S-malonyltransferase n=1 Tax=Massilia antarctica TaxID=2765360 RepID=UPI0006BB61FE|nr:acyltransferase domain-containing protein [Massilia sp. H27-R4]CUI03045.1 Malonyl CoA acyl carrier protein transacylase [Janthinobacterium sp. CG23_2]CUU26831.1 Malonyl CoA acyl carrier protein transacylase [Janthinobacterium sp. CG23_2]